MNVLNNLLRERIAVIFVALMVVLQGFYAIYAFIAPADFAGLRGTELFALGDVDWVRIYASRTLFVSLVVGFLLINKSYALLAWVAAFGMVMPLSDAYLAYAAHAEAKVVFKHLATAVYLLITFFLLLRLKRPQA